MTSHSVCCLDLACRVYHHPINSTDLLRYSGHTKPSAYAHTLRTVQALLSLSPQLSIPQLCIQHSASPAHSSLASRILTSYHHRLPSSLPPAQRPNVDLTRPSHPLVAFYLAARKTGDPLDRDALAREGGVAAREWRAVEASMLSLCAEVLGVRKRKKRGRQGEEERLPAEDEVLRGEEVDVEKVGEVEALVGTRTAEYTAWRERVMAQAAVDQAAVAERVQSDNFDDEAEYGDDEATLQLKRRRAPKQSTLPFAAAPTRPAKRVKRLEEYTGIVVL